MKRNKSAILTSVAIAAAMTFQGMAFAADTVNVSGTAAGDTAAQTNTEKQLDFSNCEWQGEIDEMLDAGDYVKGEVVAGVEPGAVSNAKAVVEPGAVSDSAAASEDNASVSDQLIASGEGLMKTTATSDDMELIRIKSSSMTTEQILESLKNDNRVLFAEPNYITEQESVADNSASVSSFNTGDASAGKKTAGASTDQKKSQRASVSQDDSRIYNAVIDDSTNLQWGNYKDAEMTTKENPNPSINVPDFAGTGSNMKNEAIAAVIDAPVDYHHPDLKDVVYKFTSKQQKKLKCGKYGYNTNSKNGKLRFFSDCDHGTHCAGILGGNWNGKGISGVASKAKIISVQNMDEEGNTSLSCDLRAFDFVKRARKSGIKIRLTSNSWGLIQSSKAINAAVYELGKKYGIISVFAAGNDTKECMNTNQIEWTLRDNPYVVVVSAMDMNDQLADFSSYGVAESTLGAPGTRILSGVRAESAEYIPDMTKTTNKFYEGFEGNSTKVTARQLDENGKPVDSPAVTVSGEATFSGQSALKIHLDRKYFGNADNGGKTSQLEIDLGDLSGNKIVTNDNFRFSVLGKLPFMCESCVFTGTDRRLPCSLENGGDQTAQWTSPYCKVPEGTDFKNMKIQLDITLAPKGDTTIYIDSIGIGSQLIPYSFYDGTSMATPQVAGSALVLAGNNSKLKGTAFARKIAYMTRPNKSLEGKTMTGGVLDFASVTNGKTGPLITSIKVKGKKVTIKGSNLGSAKGKVNVYRFVTGKKDAKKTAKITKWTSKNVTLKLKKKFKGIMKVKLTGNTGRSFIAHKFISKSSNVYKTELPFSKSTGKPFTVDAQGDYESDGPLTAIKGKLYYLPKLTLIEQTPACKKLMRYDTKTKKWKRLPDLPEWLEFVSTTEYKGKLIVKGTKMEKTFDGSPVHASQHDNKYCRIYVFDPNKYNKLKKSKKKKAWSRASAKKVKMTATILNRKGKLLLAGGCDYTKTPPPGQLLPEDTSDLVNYDLKKGAGKRILKFGSLVDNPSVAVKGNKICIYDSNKYRVFMVNGSKLTKLNNALPGYVMTGEEDNERINVFEREGAVVPAPKGFVLVGPAANNGSSDTFLIKNGSKKFKAMKMRASDARVIAPAATSYKGRLYVIGSSALEKGMRFFRSTKL